MRIAVVAPSPVPFTRGGAERALWGIQAAINDLTVHEAEMIKIPVRESTFAEVIAGYRTFSQLDLSHFDRILTTKYPSWMVEHPDKTILMMHVLRGVYDTYKAHGQPLAADPQSGEVAGLYRLMDATSERSALPEFFARFQEALETLGPGHPDLVFPGPFSRRAIRWLDAIAMAPTAVTRYLSQSKTVAQREGYFPPGIRPQIVNLPGRLPPAPRNAEDGTYLFTASRLDGPKRLDMLIDAMAYVPADIELRIAGTGAQGDALRTRAAEDPRIRFLGFTRNDQLPELYANALAIPFIPADEDLGLVTLEAFSQATAVVTCRDSGGPTEFVIDNVTGLVADPHPASLGAALTRLVTDPALARRLGEAGRRRGDAITWDHVVAAILGEPVPGQVTAGSMISELEAIAPSGEPSSADPGSRIDRRRRVVVLATFGINEPRHGGQLRCRNLYGTLCDADALDAAVEVVALIDADLAAERHQLAPGLSEVVVPRSDAHDRLGREMSAVAGTEVTDLVAGSHIELSPAYLAAVADAVADADAVILAEPYLLPALEHLGVELPVLYDAYNVEADLKATVYPATPAGRELLAQVVDVEGRAVRHAQAITTCSASDASVLARRYDRDADAFTVIANGAAIPDEVPSPGERRDNSRRWRDRYGTADRQRQEPKALVVFFGSWHPPNLEAAELLLDVAPLLPDVAFLSVGHHGDAFAQRDLTTNISFPGIVGDTTRRMLLASADVALNPMQSGSGTNLKLIEYLAQGVPVVSTPFGARGVEVVDGRHLLLADAEPEAFAAAVAATLANPDAAAQRAVAGRELAVATYGWPALGRRLAEVLDDLMVAPARR